MPKKKKVNQKHILSKRVPPQLIVAGTAFGLMNIAKLLGTLIKKIPKSKIPIKTQPLIQILKKTKPLNAPTIVKETVGAGAVPDAIWTGVLGSLGVSSAKILITKSFTTAKLYPIVSKGIASTIGSVSGSISSARLMNILFKKTATPTQATAKMMSTSSLIGSITGVLKAGGAEASLISSFLTTTGFLLTNEGPRIFEASDTRISKHINLKYGGVIIILLMLGSGISNYIFSELRNNLNTPQIQNEDVAKNPNNIETLKREKEIAIAEENYERAIELRDLIMLLEQEELHEEKLNENLKRAARHISEAMTKEILTTKEQLDEEDVKKIVETSSLLGLATVIQAAANNFDQINFEELLESITTTVPSVNLLTTMIPSITDDFIPNAIKLKYEKMAKSLEDFNIQLLEFSKKETLKEFERNLKTVEKNIKRIPNLIEKINKTIREAETISISPNIFNQEEKFLNLLDLIIKNTNKLSNAINKTFIDSKLIQDIIQLIDPDNKVTLDFLNNLVKIEKETSSITRIKDEVNFLEDIQKDVISHQLFYNKDFGSNVGLRQRLDEFTNIINELKTTIPIYQIKLNQTRIEFNELNSALTECLLSISPPSTTPILPVTNLNLNHTTSKKLQTKKQTTILEQNNASLITNNKESVPIPLPIITTKNNSSSDFNFPSNYHWEYSLIGLSFILGYFGWRNKQVIGSNLKAVKEKYFNTLVTTNEEVKKALNEGENRGWSAEEVEEDPSEILVGPIPILTSSTNLTQEQEEQEAQSLLQA